MWSDARLLCEFERWVWFPPDGTAFEDAESLLSIWPGPDPHGTVHWSRVAPGPNVKARARELIERMRVRAVQAGGKRLRWNVRRSTQPPQTAALLEQVGFSVVEELNLLNWELGEDAEPRLLSIAAAPDATVELARDAATLRACHELGAELFGHPPPTEGALAGYTREMERAEAGGTRVAFEFLARIGGVPAGVAAFRLAPAEGGGEARAPRSPRRASARRRPYCSRRASAASATSAPTRSRSRKHPAGHHGSRRFLWSEWCGLPTAPLT